MFPAVDDATAQFLETAAADLQAQMRLAGIVEGVSIAVADRTVSLVAQLRIATRTVEVSGSGQTLIDAYADLRRRVPEVSLVAAYLELNEHLDAARQA